MYFGRLVTLACHVTWWMKTTMYLMEGRFQLNGHLPRYLLNFMIVNTEEHTSVFRQE